MANEKRLIDANSLINNYDLHIVIGAGDNICIDIADIAKAPTVDAVEVVHGRWIEKEEKIWNLEKPIVTGWECSKCGEMYGHYTYNYCPNCGAKMDMEVDA